MLILSVSEAKRQIKDLVAQAGLRNQVFYITRYSRPKAVMMSVEQYESLVRQVSQLQDDLARVWAALDAPADADQPVLFPTPDGGTRLFQPRRPVTPDVREAIRRAALSSKTRIKHAAKRELALDPKLELSGVESEVAGGFEVIEAQIGVHARHQLR